MKTNSQRILIFIADEYEDLELQYPRLRILEADKEVQIAGEKKEIYTNLNMGIHVKQIFLLMKFQLEIMLLSSYQVAMRLINCDHIQKFLILSVNLTNKKS